MLEKPLLPDQYMVAMRRGDVELAFVFKPERVDLLPEYIASLKRFVDEELAK